MLTNANVTTLQHYLAFVSNFQQVPANGDNMHPSALAGICQQMLAIAR